MIRVCSLDFLDREIFESDVKYADGRVIVSAGEKITPEIILSLYFKEIYVEKPLKDIVPVRIHGDVANIETLDFEGLAQDKDKVSSNQEAVEPEEKKVDLSETISGTENVFESEIKNIEESILSQLTDEELANLRESEDLSVETEDSDLASVNIDKSRLPKPPEFDFEEVSVNDDKSKNTPIVPEIDLSTTEKPKEAKAPVFGFETEEIEYTHTEMTNSQPVENFAQVEEKEKEVEDKKEKTTNEKYEEYKRESPKIIADHAVLLAEELKYYSEKEIDEIKIAAMNCNLGLEKFDCENILSHNFEMEKAAASHEIAYKKGEFSAAVLEIIKNHAKRYNTKLFNLGEKISACDIIHIALMYIKYSFLLNSKEQALAKMLEQGGNEFNIFALHKFLRLMKNNG